MSLDGFHKLAPMGYIPKPPPQHEVHHTLPPISVAEESTFMAWMALPEKDHRTLEEYASNPVLRLVTWEFIKPKAPPPPPPSRPPTRSLPPTPNPPLSFGPPDSGGHPFRGTDSTGAK